MLREERDSLPNVRAASHQQYRHMITVMKQLLCLGRVAGRVTDLSSDEVELGVTLHAPRALGGKHTEKQEVTQRAELTDVALVLTHSCSTAVCSVKSHH